MPKQALINAFNIMSAKPIARICDCKGSEIFLIKQIFDKKNGEVYSTSPLDWIVIVCDSCSQAIIYIISLVDPLR